MKKLYKDLGGECEYYIVKTGKSTFESHAFEMDQDGNWKHYERTADLTEDDIKKAAAQYGEQDAEFLAAMDDLQYWADDFETLTDEEKEEIIEVIERER